MTNVDATLTMRDIADLAGVQRAVVSMWRRRPQSRGRYLPFPAAVTTVGSVERFRRDDVVEWLAQTGRGNNVDHRLDAPTLSVPDGTRLEDLVALLCLYALGGDELSASGPAELRGLAERLDPADQFLLSEVRALDVTDTALQFVDELVANSFGLVEALNRLERGPAGRALGLRELTDDATRLIAAVVSAAVLHLDPDGPPVAFTGDQPSLGLALAADAPRLVVSGGSATDRRLRRRAVLHELEVADSANGPTAHVVSVMDMDTEAALTRIDDVLLDNPAVAVVIGAASVLCERLRGEAERARAQVLRLGTVAAAFRLPRGMWREAHRQALGIWVCDGRQRTDRPGVADLGAHRTAELSLDDIAADVSGALARDDRRAFRYLRAADLGTILTGAPIVPQGAQPPRWGMGTAGQLSRAQRAALRTSEPIRPLDVLVSEAPGALLLRQRSLGELADSGELRLLNGRRIDLGHASPAGTVRVLSADGQMDGVALDPFDAERHYPRAHRTEPGDVVFVGTPRPLAVVDEVGRSLVASPSRILRLGERAGLGPHTLAAIINHRASTSEWQTWSTPVLDRTSGAALESALQEASLYAADLRDRRDAIHDLVMALIDGVAAGAVTVVPRTAEPRSDTPEGR